MNCFGLNIRFQIVTILFMTIIMISYIRREKLPLFSTKCFNVLLGVSIFNLVFDLVTVYTITHMDIVPEWVNRLCHQAFIGSIDAIMACFYFYVSALGGRQRRFTRRELIIRLLPLAVGLLGVLTMPIFYYVEEDGFYSYGPMPMTIYMTVAIYMLMILIQVHKDRKHFSKDRLFSVRAAMFIWIAAALIQLMYPTFLISGVAIGLMIFFLYLSFENPREMMDAECGCFNKTAYHNVLTDLTASGKKFYVVNVCIKDMTVFYNLLGQEAGTRMIFRVISDLKRELNLSMYHSRGNIFSLICKDDEQLAMTTKLVKDYFEKPDFDTNQNYRMKCVIYVLEYPKYAYDIDNIYDVMNYVAKYGTEEDGENRIVQIQDDIIAKQKRYLNLQTILTQAVEQDGFEVYYQPIYEVKTKTFASAEALVRLKDRTTLGFVSPEIFIPVAEKKGLVMKIGEIVFEKVCRFSDEVKLPQKGVHYIEVNLSGVQAVDETIKQQLLELMQRYHIDPDFINLEITETASVEYMEILKRNMNELRKIGCSFSMDDFGTGYSNLSQMAEVRYDLIKLDKSLLWPCFEENEKKKARIVLEGIISLIQKLKVKIVCEGVETKEQAEYLSALGVDYLQGYYFSKPIPQEEYLAFLEKKA